MVTQYLLKLSVSSAMDPPRQVRRVSELLGLLAQKPKRFERYPGSGTKLT